MDRKLIQVNVFETEIFGSMLKRDRYAPDPLLEVREWVDDLLKKIPQEYQESARLEIDSVGGYEGEHHAEATVFYLRPENDQEMKARIADEDDDRLRRERDEREILERLKSKYEQK